MLSSLLLHFGFLQCCRLLCRAETSAHIHYTSRILLYPGYEQKKLLCHCTCNKGCNRIHLCLMQALASEKRASGSCISAGACNFATASILQCLHAAHTTKHAPPLQGSFPKQPLPAVQQANSSHATTWTSWKLPHTRLSELAAASSSLPLTWTAS